jgi:peroxiredoxin
MRKLISILTFLSLVTGSCQNKNTCRLIGTISNCKDSTILYLENLDSLNTVDSVIVLNGTFSHQLQLSHPTKFALHNKRSQYDFRDRKSIWLEPSEINIKGDFAFLKNLKVEGSLSQIEFEKYNQLLSAANKRINQLQEQLFFRSATEKVVDQNKIDSLKNNLSQAIVGVLIEDKNSYLSLNELYSECYLAFRHLDKEQIKTIYTHLPDGLRCSDKGIEIKKYFELPEPSKIGDMAPEIIQVTPSGYTIKLSDFRGKYVLLDFWSSSCAPCRGEFKWLRKIYSKYHPIGLEIFGVSGDNDKRWWVDAIKHDSIPWVNISDLKGWHNEAFLRFDIKRIPDKFLIDPQGLIIQDGIMFSSESIANHVLNEILVFKHSPKFQIKL